MIHLYYASVGADSAKALAERIRGLGAQVDVHKQKYGAFGYGRGDLCVNWGATCPDKGTHAGKWLNRDVTHNKLRQLEIMHRARVPVVEWAATPRDNGVWYARRLNHRDGDDLEKKLRAGDFYVKHVDTTREYRAHVFQGEVLRFSLKVRSDKFLEPGESPNDVSKVFRIGNGWCFSDANHKDRVGLHMRNVAIDAVMALGYDFGGVDIAYKLDGSPIVFEVNSAPWLGGEMQRAYAKRIVALA